MVRAMVFNATFNNISVILWWSVLLEEETRVPGQNSIRVRFSTDKFVFIPHKDSYLHRWYTAAQIRLA